MMKTLGEFLKSATLYPTPVSDSENEKKINDIFEFCCKHGLDKEFLVQVENNPEWLSLAKETVYYNIVETAKANAKHFPFKEVSSEPAIHLMIWDRGRSAVIKIEK